MLLLLLLLQDLYEATITRLSSTFNANDFRSQLATFTLGSGAVAAILCRSDLAPPDRDHRLTGAIARCATYSSHMCTATWDKMSTDPSMLLHGSFVIEQTMRVAEQPAPVGFGWSRDNIDLVVSHQVGTKGRTLGVKVTRCDPEKAMWTFPRFGNIGPATIGMALSVAEKEGRVKAGDRIALMGFGSGINCLMAEVIW
jgi:3-oxoacyl-[acyl-carrier-protein] synthase-3